MRTAVVCLVLIFPYQAGVAAAEAGQQRLKVAEAKALVMASLTDEQRRLPRVEALLREAPDKPRFLYVTVSWEGTDKGSVVVGNYAVDSYTGDVFNAVISCYEQKNKRLQALQSRVRAKLHLSQSEYRRLKTKGPLCEEQP